MNHHQTKLLAFAKITVWFFVLSFAAIQQLLAQEVRIRETASGKMIELIAKNGDIISLSPLADDDEDGIDNLLEINGFTYNPADGLQPWNGDSSVVYYRTDPLRWSTDGDPYSDYMEVSGVNMPAGVSSPENDPLVAARPVISIGMTDYDVIPITEISNTSGGEQSSSYTNETSSTDEVGGSVTVGAELNPFKLVSAEVTASYSHTWTSTQSTTSTFGTNWSDTRTTNPSQAARLKLRVFMKNLGSATALDVVPTFNLVLGEKTIATITPNQAANRLEPKGLPNSRYPASGTIAIEKDNQNNDIILTMEELKAIQMGAPLGLVVTQVDANVVRWNPDTQSYDAEVEWSSFESEIDPVVVNVKANLGDDEIYHYQVYVGTDYYTLDYTFSDVLSHIFDVTETGGQTYIDNRLYPDDWYVSTPSAAVINEWNTQGQPGNLLGLSMFRNTQMVMMSPGNSPIANVDLATFSPDFKHVYVSAFPGNFPILSVKAQVTVNGQLREVDLSDSNNALFTNDLPFESQAETTGKVFVENARGDVTESNIVLPALYKNAAEVKEFAGLLPSPGGEFLLFSGGDPDKPAKLFCLFDDPKTGDPLATPREYLTLPNSSDTTNYIDWIQDTFYRRVYFSKIRINPDNFKIDGKDTTFTVREWISTDQGTFYGNEPLFFGSIRLTFAHMDTAFAKVDLSGTPFSLDPFTEFQRASRGAIERISIDETRQKVHIRTDKPVNHSGDSEGFIGLKPDSLTLAYNREFSNVAQDVNLSGNTLAFNRTTANNPGYLNMGNSPTMEASDAITLEAWIRPEASLSSQPVDGIIINREGEFEIARFTDGTIRWAIAVDSPHWVWTNTGYVAKENEWVHIALVYDSNAPEPAIMTYINGNLFHAMKANGIIGDHSSAQNLDDFRIGGRQAFTTPFSGSIDEVRYWHIARSGEQIREALTDTLSADVYGIAQQGIVGYWRFDELEDLGIGGDGADDVRDFSVNGNHGDIVGDVLQGIGITGIDDGIDPALADEFVLYQNYPNPFNPETHIRYQLPKSATVKLEIFNLIGEKVAELASGQQTAGTHTIIWNGRNRFDAQVASGVYLYRLQAGSFVQTRKMILLR